ncbi:MAG: YbjN domain-containing protein [Phycisphaerales bacterium]
MLTPESVKSHFESNGIKFMQTPDGDRFGLGWSIGRHHVQTEVLLHEGGSFVIFRTTGLARVPHGHPAHAALLERLNEFTFKYRVLKAMIDPEDGEVTVSFEQWCTDGTVEAESFGRRYQGFLRFVETVLDAVDDCLNRNDLKRQAC